MIVATNQCRETAFQWKQMYSCKLWVVVCVTKVSGHGGCQVELYLNKSRKIWKLHSDGLGLYGGCLSTSHHMAISWLWILLAAWGGGISMQLDNANQWIYSDILFYHVMQLLKLLVITVCIDCVFMIWNQKWGSLEFAQLVFGLICHLVYQC